MMDKNAPELFGKLLLLMDELRAKCPWDKKQTMESLRHLTIEETYELADAIIANDLDEIKKELGDLILHVVFYAKIGAELGAFDISSVIESINEKLIIRHPHIFGEAKAENAEQVKENWERIKLRQGEKMVLSGVPVSLPAMIKAYRIQEKARGVGFDWENPRQVWEKVKEELDELQNEISKNSPEEKIEEEFGDVLFALINYARFINVNPENALERTNRKFIRRFAHLEKQALAANKQLGKMSADEMDMFWNEAKKSEEG